MSSQSTYFYELVRKTEDEIDLTLKQTPNVFTDKDESDRLLIHWAALGGREALVQCALDRHPTQLDAEDDSKYTPLILATLGGHLAVVTLLTLRGANLNHRNKLGHSALQYSCSKGFLPIAKHLVEFGANVNVLDGLNETPLHRAATRGSEELVTLLLENGANPNVQNSVGNTPLHLACEEDQRCCALRLLKGGASTFVENRDDKTPLDLATRATQTALANAGQPS
ncbi:26S proteasome non-ATPase regulatory subunit 10-like [Anopheles funestus]|uniref:26S proteasome non-ATPase regulatory subunit 10-like n=1 Tax=Anopheles funestus TaxID=62324 RepID=UPI0020C638DB|nr:26S proteasome non-ATPase regulatory subunit 10-like [Anopheles funestus]